MDGDVERSQHNQQGLMLFSLALAKKKKSLFARQYQRFCLICIMEFIVWIILLLLRLLLLPLLLSRQLLLLVPLLFHGLILRFLSLEVALPCYFLILFSRCFRATKISKYSVYLVFFFLPILLPFTI